MQLVSLARNRLHQFCNFNPMAAPCFGGFLPVRGFERSGSEPIPQTLCSGQVELTDSVLWPVSRRPEEIVAARQAAVGLPRVRQLGSIPAARRDSPGTMPERIEDWNGRNIQVVRSKGGVIAVCDFSDGLMQRRSAAVAATTRRAEAL